jgi:hypothetical protein
MIACRKARFIDVPLVVANLPARCAPELPPSLPLLLLLSVRAWNHIAAGIAMARIQRRHEDSGFGTGNLTTLLAWIQIRRQDTSQQAGQPDYRSSMLTALVR